MCLALQQPHRGPSGKLIKSIGGLFGGSWIRKSSPGCEFLGKSWAYFNDFIFHPERFLEGLERVLGVCSRAKEDPKGGAKKVFQVHCGAQRGSQNEKGPSALDEGGRNGGRGPLGKTIITD